MALTPAKAKEEVLALLLAPVFQPEAFRVDRSRPFAFICGGNNNNGCSALRYQFLDWVTKPPILIVPVLAERTFAHQLVERNLQKFEQFLASTADCVLIFVESPGSFAETGLFAALNQTIKKTFIVNTREQARKNSFLNTGPIKLIRRKSNFDTVFELADKCVTPTDAQGIVERILSTCTKYEKALVFHPPEKKFTSLNIRLQLGCVHLTVSLMRAVSADLVTSVLREYFKEVDREVVEMLLSLLTGINLIRRTDELYFNPRPDGLKNDELIRSVAFSEEQIKARVLEWQAKNNSQAATFLREQLGVDI
jgi:hypothetical protein